MVHLFRHTEQGRPMPHSRACRYALLLVATTVACPSTRPAAGQGVRITGFRVSGAQVDWSPTGNDRIAFAAKGADGYYDVHLADPDGSHDVCLTCDTPGLPRRHAGG